MVIGLITIEKKILQHLIYNPFFELFLFRIETTLIDSTPGITSITEISEVEYKRKRVFFSSFCGWGGGGGGT